MAAPEGGGYETTPEGHVSQSWRALELPHLVAKADTWYFVAKLEAWSLRPISGVASRHRPDENPHYRLERQLSHDVRPCCELETNDPAPCAR